MGMDAEALERYKAQRLQVWGHVIENVKSRVREFCEGLADLDGNPYPERLQGWQLHKRPYMRDR